MAQSKINKTLDANIKLPIVDLQCSEASVPVDLYADCSIPSDCIRLFCIIKQLYDEGTRFCTASDKTLAYYAGISESTVRLCLERLHEAGFLTIKFDAVGESRNRKAVRYLHVSNDTIDIFRDIVETLDDKENTKRVEAFENDPYADCDECEE